MEPLHENRDLLLAYRRAEPAALETVYRTYVRVVAAFLRQGFGFNSQGRRLLFTGYADPEELRDALQETFLLAFGESARLGYDGLSPFKHYLLGIARNVVLGRFRKDVSRLRAFRPVAPEGEEIGSDSDAARMSEGVALATGDPSPEEAVQHKEIRRVVQVFVGELSSEQRELVRLYFMEHLSQEATAEALSVDRNRVRKHIRVIRKKLWKRIRREGLDHALPFRMESLEVKT